MNAPSAIQMPVAAILTVIHGHRFDLSNEKMVQAGMEEAFAAAGISFEREKPLSESDIPDFITNAGVVIECKVRGARKMDIYRQLCRYADHPEVSAIILASNIAMGLPAELNGKPAFMASLSRGWI